MKERRKKFIIERVAPIRKYDDDFDIKFWQKAGALARFGATWQMIAEFYNMKGRHGHKQRLQRHIQNIKQA